MNQMNVFDTGEAGDFPKQAQIYTGLFAESNDLPAARRDFSGPWTRFFQATDDEPKLVRGMIDQINHDPLQSADAQTEHDLHDGLRRLHEGHGPRHRLARGSTRGTSAAKGIVRRAAPPPAGRRDGNRASGIR